ncbi:CLUMA_CG004929, isoform A [Clunio marinus]|uniref:CLUMA_CG004929, isoform A n=1 Tax=Clunio marinus TaxID=568069 RepID=A0A1J1HYQ2_9DIPT|nr:CLUMA_CG004929, isoform A [Clunio marinus]
MKSESRENLVRSNASSQDDVNRIVHDEGSDNEFDNIPENILTATEKKFLLTAERGDCATVKTLIQEFRGQPEELNINCVDPLERSALIAAIENENIELIHLLLDEKIHVKDALLHAIKEEYVEAVETLLQYEEQTHIAGAPYSWESVDRSSSSFTQDITPLILAAHKNNYEILKILLDRGASLPMPHDVRCGCDECVVSSEADSLRHSQSRINAYKALSSSSLIALSSRDPILTAFELSWELRRLSRMETEFRAEYNAMRKNTQDFATALLDHSRTSNELEIMLNYNPNGENWEPGERQTLDRLKLAIKYKQKQFVAHPNVQQLLAKIWYEGLPGFRRKGMIGQCFQVAKLASMFPFYCTVYMLAPNSEIGQFMKKPFVKFITHSASYAFFLTLLGAASQRVEFLLLEWLDNPWIDSILEEWKAHERGALPGFAEFACMIYIVSLIWGEIRPLQVSLGRMIIDIIKFFFIYTLVLFAFGCGLNQLLWYYADLERDICYHDSSGEPDFDDQEKACAVWRRFANLFETSQSLFWASFGLVDLLAFDLKGIKSFTRFWALLMFGSYSVINIIVLLNMLIAMMSNSYQIISERSDKEWKFARSHLWISYFDDGATLPPPFNLFPTVKVVRCGENKRCTVSIKKRSQEKARKRHDNVMKLLVRRYVCDEQRKRDDFGVTEDDVMEIRQDISTLRYELIDIFNKNGMKTPTVNRDANNVAGKKGKMMERRILKDFQIGIVEGIINETLHSAEEPKDVFSAIAKAIGKRSSSKMKKEDWNTMVRKSTRRNNPIGSTSEALQRQRSRQSLRRQIMESQNSGITMNTESLLEFNPKLADVSHTTRVAYAKFMTSKIKKELKFENDKIQIENEKVRARGIKALNKFKANAGILKKAVETIKESTDNEVPSTSGNIIQSVETDHLTIKDFRARTPIEEDPREEMQTPNRSSTPDSTLNASTPTPTPFPSEIASPLSATSTPQSSTKQTSSSSSTESCEPTNSNSSKKNSITSNPELNVVSPVSSITDSDDEIKDDDEPKHSTHLNVPKVSSRSNSPTPSLTSGDKGKSKISGKTLTGWI